MSHRITWTCRVLAATAITGVAMLALTGCGVAPTSAPRVEVIVASATASEPAPVLSAADRKLLREAGADSTSAAAYVMNPNTGQASRISLTPRRPDGQVEYSEPRRNQLLARNLNRVQAALNRLAATSPFDLLSDLATAARAADKPGTLLVLSSGLSTAGAIDLRQVGWDADWSGVAADLKRRGQLPDLTGWHVVFSGLGDTAGHQPALPLPQRRALSELWLAICHAASAATCRSDDLTRPEPQSRSTLPVPIVPVPKVISVRGPRGRTHEIVPDDELFAFGSAALLPEADLILASLARRVVAQDLFISIAGFASPEAGSQAVNLDLSKHRAIAVLRRLLLLGVPKTHILSVTWHGTAGLGPQACIRDGHLDEAICSQFRRVEISIRPAPGVAA